MGGSDCIGDYIMENAAPLERMHARTRASHKKPLKPHCDLFRHNWFTRVLRGGLLPPKVIIAISHRRQTKRRAVRNPRFPNLYLFFSLSDIWASSEMVQTPPKTNI